MDNLALGLVLHVTSWQSLTLLVHPIITSAQVFALEQLDKHAIGTIANALLFLFLMPNAQKKV